MTTSSLFSSFSEVDKSQWLSAIQQELKKEPLQNFDWQLNDDILISPFVHPDDMPSQYYPISATTSTNIWEIAEVVKVKDAKIANPIAIEALASGANALIFDLDSDFQATDLPILLHNIQHEWITTHFIIDADKLETTIAAFIDFLTTHQQDSLNVKGSFRLKNTLLIPKNISFFRLLLQKLPLFQFITISSTDYYENKNHVAYEIGMTLFNAHTYLAQLAPTEWHQFQFIFFIDQSYFVNIAKLRAFRLVWQFLLEQYQPDTVYIPYIEVQLAKNTFEDDIYSNIIKATTMAMSAIVAGANRINIEPADIEKNANGTPFTRRIARNLHHLMQLESHLDHVIDPAAGSYYIEDLTNKIAEAAWKIFQNQIIETQTTN